jgi:hypothetical protein
VWFRDWMASIVIFLKKKIIVGEINGELKDGGV